MLIYLYSLQKQIEMHKFAQLFRSEIFLPLLRRDEMSYMHHNKLLIEACKGGFEEDALLLLEHPKVMQFINLCGPDGKTPLHYAAELCSARLIRSMLQAGASASLFKADADGISPAAAVITSFARDAWIENAQDLLVFVGQIKKFISDSMHIQSKQDLKYICKWIIVACAYRDAFAPDLELDFGIQLSEISMRIKDTSTTLDLDQSLEDGSWLPTLKRIEPIIYKKIAFSNYTMMVLLSDSYIKLKTECEDEKANNAKRFFQIALQLPLHLQQKLSNVCMNSSEHHMDEIPEHVLKFTFRKFAESESLHARSK